MTRWLETGCGCCRGYGVVSDYSGGDFNGATECDACGGQGFYVVSEKDRAAMWPGGPFLGTRLAAARAAAMKSSPMEPGAFARLGGREMSYEPF